MRNFVKQFSLATAGLLASYSAFAGPKVAKPAEKVDPPVKAQPQRSYSTRAGCQLNRQFEEMVILAGRRNTRW